MGWAYGINNEGREIGYGVEAVCDQEGCTEEIDRGLWGVCGGMHDGDEHSCGRYFCGAHIFHGLGLPSQMCEECSDRFREENPEVIDAAIKDFEELRSLALATKEPSDA